MDRGAWKVVVHGIRKELNTTEHAYRQGSITFTVSLEYGLLFSSLYIDQHSIYFQLISPVPTSSLYQIFPDSILGDTSLCEIILMYFSINCVPAF